MDFSFPHQVSPQLSLGLELEPRVTLDDFNPVGNEFVVRTIRDFLNHESDRFIYLYGPAGCGKTHLLQATCSEAMSQLESAMYVSFKDRSSYSEDVLSNLESLSLICLDDVDDIAGDDLWEHALFQLYNAVFVNGTRLIMAGEKLPVHLGLNLQDLTSRLAFGLSLYLEPLTGTDALRAIDFQAKEVGVTIPEEVGQYLLTHARRDMRSMHDVFTKLKDASHIYQRQLTVPFVKEVLDI